MFMHVCVWKVLVQAWIKSGFFRTWKMSCREDCPCHSIFQQQYCWDHAHSHQCSAVSRAPEGPVNICFLRQIIAKFSS